MNVEGLSLGVAALLLVVLRVGLDKEARPLLRAPFALLVLHLAVFGADQLFETEAPAHRVLLPAAVLLLLLSIARSAVLVVLEVIVERRLGRQLPRTFREMVQGIVFAAVASGVLHEVGVEPGSLLAT